MKKLTIINDVHLGVSRVAGTTPNSALALKQTLVDNLEGFVKKLEDTDLAINGDLFDTFEVDSQTLLAAFGVFADYLSGDSANMLYLIAGNHDWSPKADKVSSFHLLAHFLKSMHPANVKVIDKGFTHLRDNIWAIPHCANQDLFELELAKAMQVQTDNGYILTHCNVIPPACHGKADHSLNLSLEQTQTLSSRFTVLNAHEHQHVFHDHGLGVHCLGNQWPSSVADCLSKGIAQSDGVKYSFFIDHEGVGRVPTWAAEDEFLVTDWSGLAEINPLTTTQKFIRVSGTATAGDAAQVVSAISKFRAKSDAFIITNGVKVEGSESMSASIEEALAEVKSFSIMSAIMEELEPAEAAVIRQIMDMEEPAAEAVAEEDDLSFLEE